MMLSLLFKVVSLQIINDGEVVDVAAVRRDISVLVAFIFEQEFVD